MNLELEARLGELELLQAKRTESLSQLQSIAHQLTTATDITPVLAEQRRLSDFLTQIQSKIDELTPVVAQMQEDAKSEEERQQELFEAKRIEAAQLKLTQGREQLAELARQVNEAGDRLVEALRDFYEVSLTTAEAAHELNLPDRIFVLRSGFNIPRLDYTNNVHLGDWYLVSKIESPIRPAGEAVSKPSKTKAAKTAKASA